MENASWKKCNMKQVQHENKQPKKAEHKKERNLEKV